MMENTAKDWLEIAFHQWLRGCDYASNLREPTRKIVRQMHTAVADGNNATAEQLMSRLQSLSNRFSQDQTGPAKSYSYEMAETLVECGRATCLMGEKLTAVRLFDEAARKYLGNDHCRAAVLWMLGCVQWQFQTRLDDAIVAWEASLEIYSSLQSRTNRAEIAKWYEYWSGEMRSALDLAIAGGEPVAPPETDWPGWAGGPSKSRSSKEQQAKSVENYPSNAHSNGDLLRSFSVYSNIPAGGFTTSPTPQTFLETERVSINRVDYYIRSLHEGRVVKLRDGEHYVVVQVKGDSMNLKNIDEGDYVLMRVQQAAENGEIVAFEINATFDEGQSTLKQYFKRNGKIILQPQSKNLNHQPFEFTEGMYDFHICGVVIAVLKKASGLH